MLGIETCRSQEGLSYGIRYKRGETAKVVSEYQEASARGSSQRQFAQTNGLPRSTLQYWLNRKATIDEDPVVVDFFESPQGIAFLHRIQVAAHVVMTLAGTCGIRLVSKFFELSGLNKFIASGYGSQKKISTMIEEKSVEYEGEETRRLALGMPEKKKVTVCQDETFHPEICLVGIEPISNYIV